MKYISITYRYTYFNYLYFNYYTTLAYCNCLNFDVWFLYCTLAA